MLSTAKNLNKEHGSFELFLLTLATGRMPTAGYVLALTSSLVLTSRVKSPGLIYRLTTDGTNRRAVFSYLRAGNPRAAPIQDLCSREGLLVTDNC